MKKIKNSLSILLVLTLVLVLNACSSGLTKEADAFFKDGKYKEAVEAYNEYLATKPKDIKSIYNRGRAYEELGDIESAKKDFIRVLDLDNENLNANLSMAQYWYNKKDFNKSIAFCDKVIATDGRESMAYLLKGRCLHQKSLFDDAKQNYDLAIEFDRKNAEAFLYRGALKIVFNQKSGACNDLNRALALGADEAKAALAKHCR